MHKFDLNLGATHTTLRKVLKMLSMLFPMLWNAADNDSGTHIHGNIHMHTLHTRTIRHGLKYTCSPTHMNIHMHSGVPPVCSSMDPDHCNGSRLVGGPDSTDLNMLGNMGHDKLESAMSQLGAVRVRCCCCCCAYLCVYVCVCVCVCFYVCVCVCACVCAYIFICIVLCVLMVVCV